MSVLVTGATGNVGRALVAALRAADEPVRALTRDPSRARFDPAVEVVAGDLGDPDSIAAAVAGVRAVFFLSSGPGLPAQAATMAAAATAAGVAHVVELSVLEAAEKSDNPITNWHRAAEKSFVDSGLPLTRLRPGAFMSNALNWAATIAEQGAVYAPYGAGRFSSIDPADIAAVAAVALTTEGHAGRTYPLSGPEALSLAEMVATLGQTLDRPLRYVDVPPESARDAMVAKGIPPTLANAIVAVQALGLEPQGSTIYPTVRDVTGRPAATFAEWARANAGAFTD